MTCSRPYSQEVVEGFDRGAPALDPLPRKPHLRCQLPALPAARKPVRGMGKIALCGSIRQKGKTQPAPTLHAQSLSKSNVGGRGGKERCEREQRAGLESLPRKRYVLIQPGRAEGQAQRSWLTDRGCPSAICPRWETRRQLPAPEGARRRLFIHRGSTEVRCE